MVGILFQESVRRVIQVFPTLAGFTLPLFSASRVLTLNSYSLMCMGKKEREQKENKSKSTLFSLGVGHMEYWTLGLWNCVNDCYRQLYISFLSMILLGFVVRVLRTLHHIVHLRFWLPRGGYVRARHLGASKGNQSIIISAQGAFRAVVETFSKL